MSDITLDRLRIVRNAIVREYQRSKMEMEKLPTNAASKDGLRREMAGLHQALVSLYQEFDELERIPMDQKPRCPFCGEEMGHWALAKHMKEHLKKGDNIRGISPAAPGLPIDNVPMFGDITDILQGLPSAGPHQRTKGTPLTPEMAIAASLVEDPPPIEVLIEGIKYKTRKCDYCGVKSEYWMRPLNGDELLVACSEHWHKAHEDAIDLWGLDGFSWGGPAMLAAGGQGGAAHPDHDPAQEKTVDRILAEQRALYPGRTCAQCWHYERIVRAHNITIPDGTAPTGGEKPELHPEHCNTFLILPEESGCEDWKHHEDSDG